MSAALSTQQRLRFGLDCFSLVTMGILERVRWLRSQLLSGKEMSVHLTVAADRSKDKVRFLLSGSTLKEPFTRSVAIQHALCTLEYMTSHACVVDRGHRYSNGKSEFCFWISSFGGVSGDGGMHPLNANAPIFVPAGAAAFDHNATCATPAEAVEDEVVAETVIAHAISAPDQMACEKNSASSHIEVLDGLVQRARHLAIENREELASVHQDIEVATAAASFMQQSYSKLVSCLLQDADTVRAWIGQLCDMHSASVDDSICTSLHVRGTALAERTKLLSADYSDQNRELADNISEERGEPINDFKSVLQATVGNS